MINFKNTCYKLTLVSHFRFLSLWNCVATPDYKYKRTYFGCSVGKPFVKTIQNSFILSKGDDPDISYKARYLITNVSSHTYLLQQITVNKYHIIITVLLLLCFMQFLPDSVDVKCLGYKLHVSHRCHVCNCLHINNMSQIMCRYADRSMLPL